MPGLDINWFRVEKGHDPNIIRKSLERRFRDPKLVDRIIEEDQVWRKSTPSLIQYATVSTLSKKNGTILASSSETGKRPTKKIPAMNSSCKKIKTKPSRNKLNRRKGNISPSSIN
jgi:seryl-tRNA synthetase